MLISQTTMCAQLHKRGVSVSPCCIDSPSFFLNSIAVLIFLIWHQWCNLRIVVIFWSNVSLNCAYIRSIKHLHQGKQLIFDTASGMIVEHRIWLFWKEIFTIWWERSTEKAAFRILVRQLCAWMDLLHQEPSAEMHAHNALGGRRGRVGGRPPIPLLHIHYQRAGI